MGRVLPLPFLTVNSPDEKPIELAFAKLKMHLRAPAPDPTGARHRTAAWGGAASWPEVISPNAGAI
jgi:transposase